MQVTFLVLPRHKWRVATILNNADIEHFHHRRQFCATTQPLEWVSGGSLGASFLGFHRSKILTIPQLLRSPLFAETRRFMEAEIKAIDSCGSNLWTFDTRLGFMISKLHGLEQVT